MDARVGRKPHRQHDRGPPRLVHLAAAHLGRADRVVHASRDRRAASALGGAARRRWRSCVERDGIDAWFDLDPAELLGAEAADYEKVTDIMDVWFDSGVMHHCVVEDPPGNHRARRSVSRRLRSASRLVSQLAADVGGAARSRAVPRRAHARIHGRRERPQDVEVARQRHRAAEGRRHARRRRAAAVDCGDRLRQRDEPLGRDPEARRRVLSAHAQHRALPARQSRRLRSCKPIRLRWTTWSRSIAGRCGARSNCRTR